MAHNLICMKIPVSLLILLHMTIIMSFRLVGGFLTLSPDYGFVLEDEEGICGYALGTVDVQPFVKKCKLSWIPFMQEKYNKPDSEKDLSEAEVTHGPLHTPLPC